MPRRPCRHARPVRHRPADRAHRPRHARPALPHGPAQDLRDGRAVRCGVDDRRPRGRDHRDRRRAAGRARAADRASCRQRPPAYSAVKIGGERAYALARARGGGRAAPSATVTVDRFERALARRRPRGLRHRVLLGHLRAQPDRRTRRRLLRGAAAHARSGRSPSRDAATRRARRLIGSSEALALPAEASSSRATRRAPPRTGGPVDGEPRRRPDAARRRRRRRSRSPSRGRGRRCSSPS